MAYGFNIEEEIKCAKVKTAVVRVPTVALGNVEEWAAFVAPVNCKIVKVGIMTDDPITGADTDYYTLGFKNKGAAGVGTDMIASKAFTAGVDATAFDFVDFGAVSNARLNEGDTVTFEKAETGNGMATPALLAFIQYECLAY